jgi:hypothetical protein
MRSGDGIPADDAVVQIPDEGSGVRTEISVQFHVSPFESMHNDMASSLQYGLPC